MGFSVVALLCSVALSGHDCRRDTALDVLPLGTASNSIECMMSAQVTLAQLALHADEGFRWQIRCEGETSIGHEHVG